MNGPKAFVSNQYSTKSTSATSAEVSRITLQKTKRTSRFLDATVVVNDGNPEACLEIKLIHEKHEVQEGDLPIVRNLAQLKKGEWANCNLDSETTLKLYEHMTHLYALANEKGIMRGQRKYVINEILNASFLSENDQDSVLSLLSRCLDTPGLAEKLASLQPQFVEDLYHHRLHQKKREGIARFETMLKGDHKENEWQKFFKDNDWILGGISDVQILEKTVNQPILAGPDVYGKGLKRGDLLLNSCGAARFTAIAEIKTPKTDLLKSKPYRSGVFEVGDELNGGLAQLRAYMKNWQTVNSKIDANRELLDRAGIYTIQPRGIIIIGDLNQVKSSLEKRECFELFRQNQKDIHIVTYDEVYERALFLFGHSKCV